MKTFFREALTVAALVGLLFAATLGLAGFAGHASVPGAKVVLPMPTPDPNPQATHSPFNSGR